MKAVGSFFGERPVLKLMYATLIRASETWRGLSVTEFEKRQLRELQEKLRQKLREETQPASSSNPKRIYSKNRT